MFSKAILAGAFVATVSAHQNFHQFWVNDVTPGYQAGIRMPPSNSPVTDLASNDLACNVGGSKVPSGVDTIPANEGDTIKVQWDQSGHPGPITHFLFGPVDDASQESGVGAGWFKIDELDNVDGKWANEIMGANNMTREFTLPTGLASGEYLLRSEMLALHGSQTVGGAQFYIGCAQLKITGTGSGSCGPTISLPGAYKPEDDNIYIPNVYNGFDVTSYTAPGGPIASCGGAAGGAAPAKPSGAPIASANSTLIAGPTAVAPVASSAVASSAVAVAETPLPTFTPVNATLPTAAPSTFATLVRPTPDAPVVAPTGGSAAPTGSAGAAKLYYQCGGVGFSGPTACEGAAKCTVMNEYYSQCLA